MRAKRNREEDDDDDNAQTQSFMSAKHQCPLRYTKTSRKVHFDEAPPLILEYPSEWAAEEDREEDNVEEGPDAVGGEEKEGQVDSSSMSSQQHQKEASLLTTFCLLRSQPHCSISKRQRQSHTDASQVQLTLWSAGCPSPLSLRSIHPQGALFLAQFRTLDLGAIVREKRRTIKRPPSAIFTGNPTPFQELQIEPCPAGLLAALQQQA